MVPFVHRRGYNPSILKSNLKMAITRLSIASNKKSALLKLQIREIASMLAEIPPREEKARIRAEAVIRDDNTIEAYEILQLHCELLSERIHLISSSSHPSTFQKPTPPPEDILSCICTLLWASYVVDNIPELQIIRNQFRYRYGKELENNALQNVNGVVNARVAEKLSMMQPPSPDMVQMYLEKIAKEQKVDWKPSSENRKNIKDVLLLNKSKGGEEENLIEYEPRIILGAPPLGYSVPTRAGSGLFPIIHQGDYTSDDKRAEEARFFGDNPRYHDDNHDDDWNDDDECGGEYDDDDIVARPSAPPLSPMTMNSSTRRPTEAPQNDDRYYYSDKNPSREKSCGMTNATKTSNTVTTMASSTTTSSSFHSRSPSEYVPVFPTPYHSSCIHSQENNMEADDNYDDFDLQMTCDCKRNNNGRVCDADLAMLGSRNKTVQTITSKDSGKMGENCQTDGVVLRGGTTLLTPSHSGLIAEATKRIDEFEEFITKFEKLNEKK